MDLHINTFSCSRDALTIRGEVCRGQGSAQPIAILCHGMMSTHAQMKPYALLLAELGYAAFAVDFNGGGPDSKSDGKTEDMTVYTEVADILATLEYARSLPYTAAGAVTLVGTSLGGFACALAAARLGAQVETLILLSPAFSFPDDMRFRRGVFQSQDPDHLLDVIQAGPMTLKPHFVTTLLNCDVFHIIPRFSGRVLLLHGTADELVRPDYSNTAYQAYRQSRAGDACAADCQLLYLNNAGHTFLGGDEEFALTLIRGFLQRERWVLDSEAGSILSRTGAET